MLGANRPVGWGAPPVDDDVQVDITQLKALMAQQQASMDEINLLLQAHRS